MAWPARRIQGGEDAAWAHAPTGRITAHNAAKRVNRIEES